MAAADAHPNAVLTKPAAQRRSLSGAAAPHVVLLATRWTPTFENCRRSLHQFGFEYSVLGWGAAWGGWAWRCEQYLAYLRAQAADRLVVLLDAYDVVALRPAEGLAQAFAAYGRDVLVGCEWYCGSAANCGRVDAWWAASRAPASHRPWRRHVNAGCVMGRAGVLADMYAWILRHKYKDDQAGLAAWINEQGPERVALDVGSTLVYNGHVLDSPTAAKTSHAFFAHYPGPLLKWGLLPHYNVTVKHVLGAYARPAYPPAIFEAALFGLLLLLACAWVLRGRHRS